MKEAERRNTILQRLIRMESAPAQTAPLPTGFSVLDSALGGGFPRGRIVEIFGPAGGGKTTLALQCIVNLQHAGLNAAFIDADHTFDPTYAASLGVDVAQLPLAQPTTAEQALDIAATLAASGALEMIAVDSAAALAPRLEVEAGISESIPGLHSRVLSNELRKLSSAIRRSGTCVLFLNQMRNRPDGEGETSAGGPPLKLFAAVRIAMIPVSGTKLRLRVLKNKAAPWSVPGELEWHRGIGFAQSQ